MKHTIEKRKLRMRTYRWREWNSRERLKNAIVEEISAVHRLAAKLALLMRIVFSHCSGKSVR